MRSQILTILFLSWVLGCSTGGGQEIIDSPTSSAWYTVYFSEPGSSEASSYRGGPDTALAEAINSARASVDMAIHDLDLWSLRDALIDAHRRGVTVRLVVESDNANNPEIEEVIQAGIEVVLDRNPNLMHNKFAVIDQFEVWTGSMNFTINGAYKNDNNLVRLRSSVLAQSYLAEFDEMFTNGLYGSTSSANTANQSFTHEGTLIEVYFSPDDNPAGRIIELINNAEHSIQFMAFSFTSDPIGDAIIAAHGRGVEVSGVLETSQASQQGGEFFRLSDEGIDVALDGNPNNMHHKVIIIDGKIVITGSYNFSRNAEERNDENIVILYNVDIANLFLEEFLRVFELRQ